ALEAAGLVGDGAASLARLREGRHIHAAEYGRPVRTIQEHNPISVVIPTLDAAAELPGAVAGLVNSAIVREIVVADGGSRDATTRIARDAGAKVIAAPRGRGPQLAAGAAAASAAWLLFLHADCRLGPG